MPRRIRFDEIPPQGLQLDVTLALGEPGQLDRPESLSARIHLVRQGGDRVLLQGNMASTVELFCDRCLTPYPHHVEESLLLLLEFQGQGMHDVEDWRGLPEGEAEVLQLEAPVVDVGDLLRQHLCLVLPLKRLCRADCPGLCPLCGELRGSPACCGGESRGRSKNT